MCAILILGCNRSVAGGPMGAGGGAGTGSSAAGADCAEPLSPRARFTLTIDGVLPPGPAGPGYVGDVTLDGVVVSSPPGIVRIAQALNGTMTQSIATLTMQAPDLPDTLVPVGALVSLRYDLYQDTFNPASLGNANHVLIQNEPNLLGQTNPISQTQRVWLAAITAEGGSDFPGISGSDPYTLDFTTACSVPGVDIRDFVVSFPGAPSVSVPQGASRTFDVGGKFAGHYTFVNISNTYAVTLLSQGEFAVPDASFVMFGT